MESAQQRRIDMIAKKRQQLFSSLENQPIFMNTQSFNSNQPNTNNKHNQQRKQEALKNFEKRVLFSKSLCIPEWMIEIPNDLKTNWICIPRPDGKRYILSSKKGKTTLFGINGFSKGVKSNLPGGSLNYRGNCVIDGILGDTCFYAIDLLQMNDNEYDDSEAESRLFLLSSRLQEDQYFIYFQGKQYPVIPVAFTDCSYDSLVTLYKERMNTNINGFLFMNRFAKICEGNTPFQLLWKDANTSQYFVNTDKDGKILDQQEVILQYTNQSLLSLEGIVVCEIPLENIEENCLMKCSIGGVFLDSQSHQWKVHNLQVLGCASLAKTLPDTISKIVFQQMARECPLTFEQILQTIQNS